MDFSEKLKIKALGNEGKRAFNGKSCESSVIENETIETEVETGRELFPEKETQRQDERSLILKITDVYPDPDQPRKNIHGIDVKKVSLRQYGQIDPITVRPHPEKENAFMIVNGERRWTALKELMEENPSQFGTIRATLQDDEIIQDEADRLTIQIVSNLHRDNMKPLEAYKGLKRLMALKGFTRQKELVDHVGLSKGQISKLLRFDDLSEADMERVEAGELSAATIRSKGVAAAKREAEDVKAGAGQGQEIKRRTSRVSISMEAAGQLVELLQKLAEKEGLAPIEIGGKTRKNLASIIEARSADIAGAL